jgi:hypothetical protein
MKAWRLRLRWSAQVQAKHSLIEELVGELQEWLFLVESGQIKGAGVHAFADRTRSLLARAKGDRA